MTAVPVAALESREPVYVAGKWSAWLRERITTDWRPGEWDLEVWLFTGDHTNPRTTLHKCAVHACVMEVRSARALCRACRRERPEDCDDLDFYAKTHVPSRRTSPGGQGRCAVRRGDVQCGRAGINHGLCGTHGNQWYLYRLAHVRKKNALTLDDWSISIATPFEQVPPCRVTGCTTPVNVVTGAICQYHNRHWQRDQMTGAVQHDNIARWAATQVPYLGSDRFSLIPLRPLVRWELLYCLQQRDANNHAVCPKTVRELVRVLSDQDSLLNADIPAISGGLSGNALSVLKHMSRTLTRAFDEMHGVKAIDKDLLDLGAIGLKGQTKSGKRTRHGVADLTVITQPWLRELLRSWIDIERPTSTNYSRRIRATTLASDALRCRPGGGEAPMTLRLADMNAVFSHFTKSSREDGKPYQAKMRQQLFGHFCDLLDFGRRADLLDDLPGGFARHSCHRIARVDENEDQVGKAIPTFVVDQLDDQVDSIGVGVPYGTMRPEDFQVMARAFYFVLRDTGRRPLEVVSLPRNCLETIDGETSLVWDNHKGRKNRRRLPIDENTVKEIQAWQRRRGRVPVPASARGYLFPAITDGTSSGHLSSSHMGETIRAWVDALPALTTDAIGHDGQPVPFERSKVFPYAFRHTYAQRHADAGTPVDVLKELMDHRAASTTMGYYTVPLKRKQQAVKTLSAHTLDRAGRPKPFSSGLAYQRGSVAVPFGGCAEPSNIKAGGHACPIRFQCSGCGFYRPDPSYLPAIEQQVNDLRADRETAQAMGAADFVIRNLTAQIDSYRAVIATMHEKLAELPPDQRAEVEEASRIMRKARAGSGHIRLPLTPVQHPQKPR